MQINNNTYFGNYAGTNNQIGYGLTGVGSNALHDIQYNYSTAWTGAAYDMTAIGLNSLAFTYAGASVVAAGNESGYNSNSIRNSVLIGASTYFQSATRTDSSQNLVLAGTGIGENTKLDSTIMMGTFTGYNTTQGGNIIQIGDYSGRKTSGTSLNNTLIGHHVVTDMDSVVAIGSNGQNIILGNDSAYQDAYVLPKEAYYSYKTGAKVQVNGDLSIGKVDSSTNPTKVLVYNSSTKKVESTDYSVNTPVIQPLQWNGTALEINPDSLSAWGSRTGSGGTTINGTGFVKASGTTVSYDNSTYVNANGLSGGQTIYGGTGSGNNLTLSSTSNATKRKIYFGANSYYDGTANTLHIVNSAATSDLSIGGDGHTIEAQQSGVDGYLNFYATQTFFSGRLGIGAGNAGALSFDNYSGSVSDWFYASTLSNNNFGFSANNNWAYKIDSLGRMVIGDDGGNAHSQRLEVNGQVKIDTLITGASTDNLITVNGGVLKQISTSTIVHKHTGTPTVAVGTNFTGTTSVTGTDYAGTLTLNTTSSTSYPTNAHLIDVTFNSTYTTASTVVISPSSAQAATFSTAAQIYVTNVTTTGFSIAIASSGTSSVVSGYTWNYIATQQ